MLGLAADSGSRTMFEVVMDAFEKELNPDEVLLRSVISVFRWFLATLAELTVAKR